MRRLAHFAVFAILVGLGACGGADSSETGPAATQVVDQGPWGEEFGMGASQGAVMTVDDDVFRLGVISTSDSDAKIEVLHSTDRAENRVETVQQGAVFIVGDYRIRFGTVNRDGVVALWSKRVDG